MKKLLSCILILTLAVCTVCSLPVSVNAYNSEDAYRDSWNYAMSILKDGEFAYFTVYHHSTYDEMVYDYPYFVKANNLLPDVSEYKTDVDYNNCTDTILYKQYKEYYNEKLDKMVEINEKFFEENFKAKGSELVYSSKGNELIVVYAEKTEIKEIEARDYTSVYYEGKELSQAQWRIDSENTAYFDSDFYEPREYELVYGLHYYETHEPVDARYEGIGYMYTPLYTHYATPDYILVFAGENSCSPAFSAGELGNYIIQEYNIYYPYIFGYHVIVTEDMSVLTLSEAYEQNIPGIMDVFEDYGLGRLRGDVTGDRKISIKDATAIQKHIAEIEIIESNYISGFALSGQANNDGMYSAYISDFDKDLSTTIKDVTAIQKHLAGVAQDDPSFDDFVPNPIPEPTTTAPRTDAQITLNGKTYEAHVGDTITLTAELNATKPFRDIALNIFYDSEILNCAPLDKDTKTEFFEAHCPNLPGGSLYYYGYYPGFKYDKGLIRITSLDDFKGIDFTKQKQLLNFDFIVVAGGDVTIEIDLEHIGDQNYEAVVQHGVSIGHFSHELHSEVTVK